MEFSGPVGALIEAQVAEKFDRLQYQSKQLLDVQEHSDQIEAVHHFRVSVRRLRTLVQSFQDYFKPKRIQKAKKKLRDVFRLAGEVRNRDITILLLRESGEGTADPLIESLSSARNVHDQKLREAVRGWVESDFRTLEKGLKFSKDERDLIAAADVAGRLLTLHTEQFFEAGNHVLDQEDLEVIHEFRIAAKQFRYLIEVFQAVYGDEIEKKLKSLKKLQDHLGRLNDIVTARSLVTSLNASAELIQWLDHEELKARTALVQNWRKSMNTKRQKSEWLRVFTRPADVTDAVSHVNM